MDEIVYNLKLINTMKNQVLRDVGSIFEYSTNGENKEELGKSISSCILALMVLSRRLGIDIDEIGEYISERINTGIAQRDICETKFNDLSTIAKFIRGD